MVIIISSIVVMKLSPNIFSMTTMTNNMQLYTLGAARSDISDGTKKVLRFITSYFRTTSSTPTIREIMRYLGFQSTNSVYKHLKKLEGAGMIAKGEGGRIVLPEVQAPVFAGVAAAGFDSPVKEHNLHITSLEKFLMPSPEKTFMLKVEGDSMIQAGLLHGDFVLVEKGRQYYPGDMVVVSTGEGYMVKYYGVEDGQALVRSANPEYPDTFFEEHWEIFGMVTNIVRKVV